MALDVEDLALLPDEHKTRYRLLEELFGSEGWKWIKAWAVANADERLNRLINAQSWESNRIETGARFAYLHLLNMEEETDGAYRAMIEDIRFEATQQVEEGNE